MCPVTLSIDVRQSKRSIHYVDIREYEDVTSVCDKLGCSCIWARLFITKSSLRSSSLGKIDMLKYL